MKSLNNAELLLFRGHGDAWVDAVAYSPDGRWIATAGGGDHFFDSSGHEVKAGTVIVWDAETGQKVHQLAGHEHLVSRVVFSPDGRAVMSSSLDGIIRFHDTASGRLMRSIATVKPTSRGQLERTLTLALSPDGRRIATAAEQETLAVWDIASERRSLVLPAQPGGYSEAAFSPDGRWLATLSGVNSDGGQIHLWDPASGSPGPRLENSRGYHSLAISPDSRTIVAESWAGTISLWSLSDGNLTRMLTGHEDSVPGLAFSPDGLFLASASVDSTVRIWDVDSGSLLRVIRGHIAQVTSLAFSPDGNRLVTGSRDATARVWDLTLDPETGAVDAVWPRPGIDGVETLVYRPGGAEFLGFSRDGWITRYDSGSLAPLQETISGVQLTAASPAYLAAFDRTGQRVLAWKSLAQMEALWRELAAGSQKTNLIGNTLPIRAVSLSADGSRAATASNSLLHGTRGEVFVWQAKTGQVLYRHQAAGELPLRVALDPTGRRLAVSAVHVRAPAKGAEPRRVGLEAYSGGTDLPSFVTVIDVDSGSELLRERLPDLSCLALAWSGDGRLLAAATSDRYILLWDTRAARLALTSRQGPDDAMDLNFSPDNRRLAIASRQGVTLVDADTGEAVLTLRARSQLKPNPHGFTPAVRFSPDGGRLLAICDDSSGAGDLAAWSTRRVDSHDPVASRSIRLRSVGRHLALAVVAWNKDRSLSPRVSYHLKHAQEIGLETAQHYLARGDLYARAGNWDRASNDLERVRSLARR